MLIFKYSIHRKNIDISNERVSQVCLIKIFHLYEQRNQWSTLASRTWGDFYLSLQDSRDFAERFRSQGANFVIEEVPAICVMGNRYALVATELFTATPLDDCQTLWNGNSTNLTEIESLLNRREWLKSAIYKGSFENLVPISNNGKNFYSHTSKSTGSSSFLAWSIRPRNILSLTKLEAYVKEINGKQSNQVE